MPKGKPLKKKLRRIVLDNPELTAQEAYLKAGYALSTAKHTGIPKDIAAEKRKKVQEELIKIDLGITEYCQGLKDLTTAFKMGEPDNTARLGAYKEIGDKLGLNITKVEINGEFTISPIGLAIQESLPEFKKGEK